MSNEILNAEKLIAEGETLPALDMISKETTTTEKRHEIILLQNKMTSVEKMFGLGTLKAEDYLLEKARVTQAALRTLSEIEQKRATTFFNRLSDNNFEITEELSRNEDFIHACGQTFLSVLKTRRQEKIKYFADLLSNTFSAEQPQEMDEFDFDFNALDNLSFTEIRLVMLLYKFEMTYSDHSTPDVTRKRMNAENWQEFLTSVQKEMNFNREMAEAYLISAEKTGLINFPRPGNNDLRRYSAHTTEPFRRLYKKINHT
ncbi:MAG: hypothetical protein KIS77_11345 [Saprospiraceae bacterium]|nr:hypothetical protein [Saprospiraceae bacterium]